jgi:hypothetical protein
MDFVVAPREVGSTDYIPDASHEDGEPPPN